MNEFFMVYVDGQKAPTYKHDTEQSAVAEAKRLAKLLNKKAYVLIAFKSYELNEFKEERIPYEQLPF